MAVVCGGGLFENCIGYIFLETEVLTQSAAHVNLPPVVLVEKCGEAWGKRFCLGLCVRKQINTFKSRASDAPP